MKELLVRILLPNTIFMSSCSSVLSPSLTRYSILKSTTHIHSLGHNISDRRFANLLPYTEPASWVSRGIPDTNDLPLAQRDHITVRSRWPVCLDIRSNLLVYREEARLRSRPTACQYPYWREANPRRADTWRQP